MSWNSRTWLIAILVCFIAVPALAADSTAVVQQRQTSQVKLTQEDFAKYNCESVGDALKTITGVYVNALGEVSLRDVSSSKVVVILDGQKLNVASGSGVNVSNISIETVQSIELLRGGRSAEYGADAVGGVIVITSKDQQEEAVKGQQSLNFRTTYGSYNRQIYSLNHSYNRDRMSTIFSYRRDLWDGNFEYTDPYGVRKDMVNNHLNSSSIFAKLGYDFGGGNNASASYSYYTANNGSPGQIDMIDPTSNILFDNHSVNLNTHLTNLYSGFAFDLGAYYLNFRTRFNDTYGTTVPVHSDHKNYATGVDLKQSGRIADLFNLSYGYSLRNDDINSTDVGKRNRLTHSAFSTISVGAPFAFDPSTSWDAALALRYDDPTDFASELSPRLSLSATNESFVRTTLAGHFARSYRAPTFNDLYWPRDSFAIGNPDLTPEYGVNYDIGINMSVPVESHRISTAVNYFRNDVTDLILWAQRPSDNLWTPNNISKTETWGIETSATIALFDNLFTTNVEYTFMKALDMGPDASRHGKYIIYRPKNKLTVTGTVKVSSWEWSTVYSYTGLRYTNPANTAYLPKYWTLDSNLSYGFTLSGYRFNTVLEFSNITNEDFQKVLGTAEPGRQYKVSVSLFL